MALVPGKTDLASGTGHWTIQIPANDAIAIDDPGVDGVFPTVALSMVLQSSQPNAIHFIGSASSQFPTPPDSIGYTAPTLITLTNETGHAINGVLLSLFNDAPQTPLDLVPGVVQFGHAVNANYAYFYQTQPSAGATLTEFSPDGKPTTATGPAASSIAFAKPIPAGGSISIATVIHNTELTAPNNNFQMLVTPT